MTPTKSITFCLVDDNFRPTAMAAINSAAYFNPDANIHIYCNRTVETIYKWRTEYSGRSAPSFHVLDSEVPHIDERLTRARALQRHGGWYIDAFDTITLRQLPEPDRFTVGESCWRDWLCAGVVASDRESPITAEWLRRMEAIEPHEWDHWTDERTLQTLLHEPGVDEFDRLDTGKINWPSETGWGGEIPLSENQIRWLIENAWIIHYFYRGAFDLAYKSMTLDQLQYCARLGGWFPRMIVDFQKMPAGKPIESIPFPASEQHHKSTITRLKTWD